MRRTLAIFGVALFPVLLAVGMVWYAYPRSPLVAETGTLMVAHYPSLLAGGAMLLLLYWGGMLVFAIVRLAGRREERGRLVPLIVGIVAALLTLAAATLWSAKGGYLAWALVVPCSWCTAAFLLTYSGRGGGRAALALVLGLGASALCISLLARSAVIPGGWLLAILAIWSVVIAVLVKDAARRRHSVLASLGAVAILGVPVAPFLYFSYCHPWKDASELRLPNGTTYHVQRFWESDVLTEEISRDRLFMHTSVVGYTDCEYTNALVVRPAGRAEYEFGKLGRTSFKASGKLMYGRERNFLLFAYPYTCYPNNESGCATNLAYDLSRGKFYGFTDLEELSPFALVGPRDRLNEGDVEALVVANTQGMQGHYILNPARAVLERERSNPNPRVRDVVERLIACIGPEQR